MSDFEKFDQTRIEAQEFELPSGAQKVAKFKFGAVHAILLAFGLLILAFIVFISLARSIEVRAVAQNLNEPEQFFPVQARADLDTVLKLPLGNRVLLLSGEHTVSLEADGFVSQRQTIQVGDDRSQRFDIQLQRTPGQLSIQLGGDAPADLVAEVSLDGAVIGRLPGLIENVPAGKHQLLIDAPLYREVSQPLLVKGKGETQTLKVDLQAAWATYTLNSQPSGASVFIDETERGTTPLTIKLEEGSRSLRIQAPTYDDFEQEIDVIAQQDITVPAIVLQPAKAELSLNSAPDGAAVILNDVFRGTTPLNLELAPSKSHQLTLYKAGYQVARESLTLAPAQEQVTTIELANDLVPVTVSISPASATVYVDGNAVGQGSRTLQLSSLPHTISVRKPGYVSQNFDLIPTRTSQQVVSANLLTEEEHYWAQLPDRYTNDQGHEMTLFKTLGEVTMGSSRRENGRRANEVQYTARLTRPFYVALHETTNKQFRAFRNAHNSGNYKGKSLDANRAPVVNISWQDAARYCNWLSKQEGLDPFYITKKSDIAGFNPRANGYRLLTEVEWAWLARNKDDEVLVYPWGSGSEPGNQRIGNYADDKAAPILKFILQGYDDGYVGPSPVGRFPANHRGLYDLDGNASEFVHDWYTAKGNSELSGNALIDPMGPDIGEFHVVRGASWAKGYKPQLRLAYRDYAAKGKHDVGFRIARYAGLNQKR